MEHVSVSNVAMFACSSWFGWNAVETVGVMAAQIVVPCTLYCNTLISILSFQGFQLPTFRVGWCSSAVIFLSSGVSASSLSHIRCNLISLSSGVSAAILSH